MDQPDESAETPRSAKLKHIRQNDLSIAVWSALAAALCLGLPAGLLFWLIIVQKWLPLHPIDDLVHIFQDYPAPSVTF